MIQPELNLDFETAKATPFFALCDRVWDAVVKASFASNFTTDECEYSESVFSNLLEEPWRIAYAIHAMEYDVLAGGFEKFFHNHASVLNDSVLFGLGLLGATEHQAIFREAIMNKSDESALSTLDGRYFTACRNVDPRELLATYIISNFDRYCRPGANHRNA